MATPTFGTEFDLILARRAKREKRTVDELLWDSSARDLVRQEVFTETGKMIDAKLVPAGVMAAIAAEEVK